jgi:phosphoglycerate dehydrogenase-like enzyme
MTIETAEHPATVRAGLQLQRVGLAHSLAEADAQRLREAHPALRFEPLPATGWHGAAAEIQALLLGRGRLPVDELLDHAPKLRWIQTAGAGVDRLLTPRLRDSGIVLTNSSGVHAVAIAEHVLGLMLAFARQLPLLLQSQAASRWAQRPLRGTFELQGQTLAVLGLGAIGAALAQKASAFGLRVLAVRRRPGPPPPGVERVVGFDGLDAVLREADHVAICLPLTDATRGLFDAPRLARLKPGAHLYNIGRGAIVDSHALLRALEGGRLAGAGLDVTDPEPLPTASRLWRHPRVIITSHTSGSAPHNAARVVDILIDNLGRAQRGEPLRNVVDLDAGY